MMHVSAISEFDARLLFFFTSQDQVGQFTLNAATWTSIVPLY
jgi:hypothetical protein